MLAFLDDCELPDRDRGMAMLNVVYIIAEFVQEAESTAFARFPLHAVACAMAVANKIKMATERCPKGKW